MTPRFGRLLRARSVALVGVSEQSFWSRHLVRNLAAFGFDGDVHLVNPTRSRQFGRPCHPDLDAVPGPVDLAFVMTSSARLDDIVEQCGKKRVTSIVALTSGLGEKGAEGAAHQAALLRRCEELGIALLGPNCLGLIDYHSGLAAFADRVSPPMEPGAVAVISQSGALLQLIHRAAQRRSLGLSHLVSVGNEAMFTSASIAEELIEHPAVRVIAMYLEGIREPEHFRRVAERARELGKPIVAVKAGRSEIAARAALAHTGALTGDDRLVDAVFGDLGVTRVSTPEDLVETAAAFATAGWPRGRRVAVVSASGGACGMAADLVQETSLTLPEIPPGVRDRLTSVLPSFGTPQNPLDTTGAIVDDPGLLRACVGELAQAGVYDAMIVNLDLPPASEGELDDIAERMRGIADAIAAPSIPILLAGTLAGDVDTSRQAYFHGRGLHVCDGLAQAVRTLGHLAEYGENAAHATRAAAHAGPSEVSGPSVSGRPAPDTGLTGEAGGALNAAAPVRPVDTVDPVLETAAQALNEHESIGLLGRYGLPVNEGRLATDREGAVAAAEALGYPVVAKIQSADIPHKSELGGVLLDLRDAGQVGAAYDTLARVAGDLPIDGVLVARHIRPVAELIAGVVVDPRWGPAVMVGMGGVFAEVLDDTSLGIPPLDHAGALAMVENLRGVKILRGARGRPAVDLSAVASFLVRLGDVAVALREQVAAIDVNPLFVRETDVLVGDALVIPRPAHPERGRTTPAAVPLPSTESDHEQIPEQMAP
ncbi:acetate--CoA ligase family protein [Streptosporangium sp. NPDC006007]|uniref:acetate--CoA ligase family protein n=1 Tax=Streptosporangium sp. NPDC006007 TaxID=3154575 RepID=UPI0033B0DD12